MLTHRRCHIYHLCTTIFHHIFIFCEVLIAIPIHTAQRINITWFDKIHNCNNIYQVEDLNGMILMTVIFCIALLFLSDEVLLCQMKYNIKCITGK